jgi:hypothetical protein
MRVARAAGLVLALVALTAAGALTALVLLSTIGGAPADDPVGRLRPVVPGLEIGATTGSPSTGDRTGTAGDTVTTDGGATTTDDRSRSDDDDGDRDRATPEDD